MPVAERKVLISWRYRPLRCHKDNFFESRELDSEFHFHHLCRNSEAGTSRGTAVFCSKLWWLANPWVNSVYLDFSTRQVCHFFASFQVSGKWASYPLARFVFPRCPELVQTLRTILAESSSGLTDSRSWVFRTSSESCWSWTEGSRVCSSLAACSRSKASPNIWHLLNGSNSTSIYSSVEVSCLANRFSI